MCVMSLCLESASMFGILLFANEIRNSLEKSESEKQKGQKNEKNQTKNEYNFRGISLCLSNT